MSHFIYKILPAAILIFFSVSVFSQSYPVYTPELKLKEKFKLFDSTKSNTEQKQNSGSQFTTPKYKVNYFKVAAITGVTAGAFWWLHNYQKNAWWSGQRGKFHF